MGEKLGAKLQKKEKTPDRALGAGGNAMKIEDALAWSAAKE